LAPSTSAAGRQVDTSFPIRKVSKTIKEWLAITALLAIAGFATILLFLGAAQGSVY
jgi:hypothetical protein